MHRKSHFLFIQLILRYLESPKDFSLAPQGDSIKIIQHIHAWTRARSRMLYIAAYHPFCIVNVSPFQWYGVLNGGPPKDMSVSYSLKPVNVPYLEERSL